MTLDEATVLIIYPSPSWRDRSALLPCLVVYIGSILPLGMERIPRMYQFFGRSMRKFREIDTGEVRRTPLPRYWVNKGKKRKGQGEKPRPGE
jgi:hypothetical protein